MLVTGATGCIGRATVAVALHAGWSVHGLARSEQPSWWPRAARYSRADVEDGDALLRAAQGCAAIVHLGAPAHQGRASAADEHTRSRLTVGGAGHAARAARSVGARFVLVSTIAVYGNPPPPYTDARTKPSPSTAYGRAKLAAEERAKAVDPETLIFRCAVVYGAGDRGNVNRLIKAIDSGRGVVVGDGTNRKSLLYSENLADRIIAAIGRSMSGTWCIADAPAPTQRELADEIASVLGKPAPGRMPLAAALAAAHAVDLLKRLRSGLPGDTAARVRSLASATEVDGAELDRALGYGERVCRREGLERAVAWTRASSEASARA